MKKGFSEPPRRFEAAPERVHNGHIGPGPKPGPKRAVNVSIDAKILKVAKEMKINLSKACEETLRKLTEDERVRRYREENREAIESYNAYIERNGVFGEELLEFDDPPV
ncbi:MAG: type II toxin-antitoxin system CcdA family antitoxin [Alphaproteobacteria bacterium]|nr:type II toxin-antitoxin system CcdA family antitoxin [Alphaproteobacteria bacterium]